MKEKKTLMNWSWCLVFETMYIFVKGARNFHAHFEAFSVFLIKKLETLPTRKKNERKHANASGHSS